MEVKAILFDADGVVSNPKFARLREREYGLTRAMTRPFFQGVFNECLVGQAELSEVLPPFLAEWHWPGTVDEFIQAWLVADDCPDRELLAAIQDLRRAGYLCGLATLQERNRANYMRTTMGFTGLFDRLFFSCDLGCLKPDPLYYQKIEAALGLRGGSILFWDDSLENVQVARSLGWQAEQYTGFQSFHGMMQEYTP